MARPAGGADGFFGRLATYKYLDMADVIAQVMVKLKKGTGLPGDERAQAEPC